MKFNKLYKIIEAMEQGSFDFDQPKQKRKLQMDSGYETYYPFESFGEAYYIIKNFYSMNTDGSDETKIPMIIDKNTMKAIDTMAGKTPIGKIYGYVLKNNYNDKFKRSDEGIFEPASDEDLDQRKSDMLGEDGFESVMNKIIKENDYLTIEHIYYPKDIPGVMTIYPMLDLTTVDKARADGAVSDFLTYLENEAIDYGIEIIDWDISDQYIMTVDYKIGLTEI